jgi:hypothetical protein
MGLKFQIIWIAAFLAVALLCGCSIFEQSRSLSETNRYEDIVKRLGWQEYLKHGQEIIDILSPLSLKELARVEVSTYRGERVAFVGSAQMIGGPNDLVIGGGFHLRVITASAKNLRPECIWCEALVRGTILQVFPESKTIVIEVDERDWLALETG